MSNKKVWFITGAGRGMGVDIAVDTRPVLPHHEATRLPQL